MSGLLLVLLGSSLLDAAVFHMELVKVHIPPSNITRTQMIQLHNKQRDQQRMLFNMVQANSRSEQAISTFLSSHQSSLKPLRLNIFVMHITIGTPPQEFRVVPDTGSPEFWIANIPCSDTGSGTRKFNSCASSTYRPDGTAMTISYADESKVHGFFGIDTVRLGLSGGLIIPAQSIGQANNLSLDKFRASDVIDGVMGLSFPYPGRYKPSIVSPILNAFNQSLLNEPMLTIWLPPMSEMSGMITYGSIDQQHCGDVTYEPLITPSAWMLTVGRIGVGRTFLTATYKGVLDTGSATIAGPFASIGWIAFHLNATWNREMQFFTAECSQKEQIFFTIAGKEYPIEPRNYLYKLRDGTCELLLTPLNSPSFEAFLILGVPFIRERCVIFDYGHKRIGFA